LERLVVDDCNEPTTSTLSSVFMVSGSDGWAVGWNGAIIRWDAGQWVPEFPSVLIVPLSVAVTLLAVAVHKRRSKPLTAER
jgi:hypothetical protein